MKINEIIRTRRTAQGLTQEALAQLLGVSAPAVNKCTQATRLCKMPLSTFRYRAERWERGKK